MVSIIEEIKRTPWIEMRLNSTGLEYVEGVVNKKDFKLLDSLLEKYFGQAAKEPEKEAYLPTEIQKIVDAWGGLRYEQSFFYSQESNRIIYATIWPWVSNPDKATLKCGVRRLV